MHRSLTAIWKPRSLSPAHTIVLIVALSSLILFVCSSVRHALFQSNALDLGYFDQALYLISQGLPPIVSFWGYHVMGGHADWILYGIAPLYRLVPSVHWLFAIQALSLAGGAIPTWYLARQAGLDFKLAHAIAVAYSLYPLVFNLNLFDFHPEVIALPLMLWAIWAARSDPARISFAARIGWFTIFVVLILGCRDALSLTVAAMGVWLILFEKKRVCGAIALALGGFWFVIVTQLIIPMFRPAGVESVTRYAYLGNSVSEIILNLFLKPGIVLDRVFSIESLGYLILLFAPVAWGISLRHLAPIVVMIPTLLINILSDSPSQRNLVHQYSLPVLPFLMLIVIAGLASGKVWIRKPRFIVLWSLVSFLALAKYGFFASNYLDRLSTWSATRSAIAQITTDEPVLTTSYIAPHLTHRQVLEYTRLTAPPPTLNPFKYVLLNLQNPGWASDQNLAEQILKQAQSNSAFKLQSERDRVYLFVKQPDR